MQRKEKEYLLSKTKYFTITHLYIVWKILKNPQQEDQLWRDITGY